MAKIDGFDVEDLMGADLSDKAKAKATIGEMSEAGYQGSGGGFVGGKRARDPLPSGEHGRLYESWRQNHPDKDTLPAWTDLSKNSKENWKKSSAGKDIIASRRESYMDENYNSDVERTVNVGEDTKDKTGALRVAKSRKRDENLELAPHIKRFVKSETDELKEPVEYDFGSIRAPKTTPGLKLKQGTPVDYLDKAAKHFRVPAGQQFSDEQISKMTKLPALTQEQIHMQGEPTNVNEFQLRRTSVPGPTSVNDDFSKHQELDKMVGALTSKYQAAGGQMRHGDALATSAISAKEALAKSAMHHSFGNQADAVQHMTAAVMHVQRLAQAVHGHALNAGVPNTGVMAPEIGQANNVLSAYKVQTGGGIAEGKAKPVKQAARAQAKGGLGSLGL
jgi:hypothetical protein